MKHKLLIVRNRLSKKIKLDKGINWFKENTPLDIEVFDMETDFDLDFIDTENGSVTGNVVNTDTLYPKLRAVIKEGEYDCVAFYYGNKATRVRLSMSSNVPLYKDTAFLQIVKDNNGMTYSHEMIHEVFRNLRTKGVNLEDPMDVVAIDGVLYHYYHDTSLTVKPSNRTMAVERLKPHWDTFFKKSTNVSTPTKNTVERQDCAPGDLYSHKTGIKCQNLPERIVTIKRSYGKDQTMGELSALNNGATFACQTLELSWKDNKTNVSCIPIGTYQCEWVFSWKRKRFLYQLKNVLNRTAIQIHSGNYAAGKIKDIEGCILLGSGFADINGDKILDIINSVVSVKGFDNFMERKPFTLIIK